MELSKQDMKLFLPLPGLQSKNFYYNMIVICSRGFKIYFKNRKQNHPNRKWNYFSHFKTFSWYLQTSDEKTYFTKCFSYGLRGSKLIFKTGNRIIQWNYFSHFQASGQKTSFTKCISFVPSGSKLIFRTGNGIIQTVNGIFSPNCRLLIKNFFYKMSPICSECFKIDFQSS